MTNMRLGRKGKVNKEMKNKKPIMSGEKQDKNEILEAKGRINFSDKEVINIFKCS